jgi:hypothetical protein
MQHFFGGRGGAGGFGGGGNIFTSAAFMMDVPLRLTFMVRSPNEKRGSNAPVFCKHGHTRPCLLSIGRERNHACAAAAVIESPV